LGRGKPCPYVNSNEIDYKNIWEYIDYNPDKWDWDKNNSKNF